MYETREERQQTYDQYAAVLDNMIAASEQHRKTTPECGADPLCIDGDTMARLEMICVFHREYPVLMISVAVNEMSRLRTQAAALTGRLEVQRQLTADITKSYYSASERADAAEEEAQRLAGLLDHAEHEREIRP